MYRKAKLVEMSKTVIPKHASIINGASQYIFERSWRLNGVFCELSGSRRHIEVKKIRDAISPIIEAGLVGLIKKLLQLFRGLVRNKCSIFYWTHTYQPCNRESQTRVWRVDVGAYGFHTDITFLAMCIMLVSVHNLITKSTMRIIWRLWCVFVLMFSILLAIVTYSRVWFKLDPGVKCWREGLRTSSRLVIQL